MGEGSISPRGSSGGHRPRARPLDGSGGPRGLGGVTVSISLDRVMDEWGDAWLETVWEAA